jgi:hypothetical protein
MFRRDVVRDALGDRLPSSSGALRGAASGLLVAARTNAPLSCASAAERRVQRVRPEVRAEGQRRLERRAGLEPRRGVAVHRRADVAALGVGDDEQPAARAAAITSSSAANPAEP